MGTIAGLLKRVESFDLAAVAEESINDTKTVIADLNAQQLFKGLRSDGSEITPQYKPITIEIKKELGQPTDRVTLKDKGGFYAGLYVEVKGGDVVTSSHDLKTEKLFKKYATKKKNIFGLNPQFRREYINQALRPRFRKNVKRDIGL